MAKQREKISQNNQQPQPSLKRGTRQVTTQVSARHDEILIHKGEWEKICDKIEQLHIIRRFDGVTALIGTVIPSSINYGYDIYTLGFDNANPLTVIICCGALFIYFGLTKVKKFTWIHPNNDEANSIHLSDLKKWINRINSFNPQQEEITGLEDASNKKRNSKTR